jgi:hypothetical protein
MTVCQRGKPFSAAGEEWIVADQQRDNALLNSGSKGDLEVFFARRIENSYLLSDGARCLLQRRSASSPYSDSPH